MRSTAHGSKECLTIYQLREILSKFDEESKVTFATGDDFKPVMEATSFTEKLMEPGQPPIIIVGLE